MVDYQFYTEIYGGADCSEEVFDRLKIRAEANVNALTFGRSRKPGADSDAVRLAVCAVADALRAGEMGGSVVSERVGDVQVTYARGDSGSQPERSAIRQAAALYLADSGMMSRGV